MIGERESRDGSVRRESTRQGEGEGEEEEDEEHGPDLAGAFAERQEKAAELAKGTDVKHRSEEAEEAEHAEWVLMRVKHEGKSVVYSGEEQHSKVDLMEI